MKQNLKLFMLNLIITPPKSPFYKILILCIMFFVNKIKRLRNKEENKINMNRILRRGKRIKNIKRIKKG